MNQRKTILLLIFLLPASLLPGIPALAQQCPVVPQPLSSRAGKGVFRLDRQTSVSAGDKSFIPLAEFLQRELLRREGVPVGMDLSQASAEIRLKRAKEQSLPPAGYSLEMKKDRVTIRAASEDGMFNGIASFLQLAGTADHGKNSLKIPCWDIEDAPYYAWRGLMLDESRHFFGKETVKFILDWMGFYKLNRFHWHLTDTPGWRMEIRQYPRLALVGGIGNHSDPYAPAAYYTQEDIAEVIAYARERHITVIPEIDMPGHAAAANRAYPEYSGGGSERYPDFTFNPGSEPAYGYLTDILRETDALFPSQMLHLGGDEVHFGNQEWESDPGIQALMRKNRLSDLKAVERYFIQRMADSVFRLNNRVLGWDEIAGASLPPEKTVIFWWRHDQPQALQTALDQGYSVVLCPRLPLYFDFVQDSLHRSGRKWKGRYAGIDDVYDFSHLLTPAGEAGREQVLGIQANLWTETVSSRRRLEYLLFPRISALAEAAWTDPASRDLPAFRQRLPQQLELYEKEGIYYYDPFTPGKHPEVLK